MLWATGVVEGLAVGAGADVDGDGGGPDPGSAPPVTGPVGAWPPVSTSVGGTNDGPGPGWEAVGVGVGVGLGTGVGST
jgi:hypothetical protein